MAVIYTDPISGSDSSGDGTEVAPFKTITHALGTAATATPIGDTIVLAPGVYRETVAIPAGKCPVFFGRGLCFIDGESIRPCIDVAVDGSRANVKSYWVNVIFRNPLLEVIKKSQNLASSLFPGDLTFHNCSFYHDTSGTGVIVSTDNVFSFTVRLSHCTVKRLLRVATLANTPASSGITIQVDDCVVDVTSTANPFTSSAAGVSQPTNASLGVNRSGYPGASGGGNVNITSVTFPYTDATFPDPDLSPNYAGGNIASYRTTGEKGGNIGSTWHPFFGFSMSLFQSTAKGLGKVTAWRDLASGVDWVTDVNYPNGSTQGPSVRINDANGDHWEIDTQSLPTATSAAVVSPVMKVPVKSGVTAKIRKAIWEADEDTVPASGSKKVIDSSAGTATRHIQYRASTSNFAQSATPGSLAWTDISKTDDLSVTFTQDFWIQVRVILTPTGT